MILIQVSTQIILFVEKIELMVLESGLQKSMQLLGCRLCFIEEGVIMDNDKTLTDTRSGKWNGKLQTFLSLSKEVGDDYRLEGKKIP